MHLLDRFIRFHIHESLWWLVGGVGILGILTWMYWGQSLVWPLYLGSSVAFLLPWFFRRRAALKYGFWKRVLFNFGYVILLAIFGWRFLNPAPWIPLIYIVYLAFTIGFMFWTVTDDCHEMISWLAHPLEYGAPPEEIHLLAQRRDELAVHRLWRYRYGEDWDVGITGLTTFAFQDQRFEDKSIDEIFADYLGWYDREGIEELRNKSVKDSFE